VEITSIIIDMKREILFKAKRSDNKEWVEGLFFKTSFSTTSRIGLTSCIQVIKDINHKSFEVIEETICQFTGKSISLEHPMFDDKLRLFENDIIKIGNKKNEYQIVFENYEWICISSEGDEWGPYKIKLSQIPKDKIRIVRNSNDAK
jgi:hypothetical protein